MWSNPIPLHPATQILLEWLTGERVELRDAIMCMALDFSIWWQKTIEEEKLPIVIAAGTTYELLDEKLVREAADEFRNDADELVADMESEPEEADEVTVAFEASFDLAAEDALEDLEEEGAVELEEGPRFEPLLFRFEEETLAEIRRLQSILRVSDKEYAVFYSLYRLKLAHESKKQGQAIGKISSEQFIAFDFPDPEEVRQELEQRKQGR